MLTVSFLCFSLYFVSEIAFSQVQTGFPSFSGDFVMIALEKAEIPSLGASHGMLPGHNIVLIHFPSNFNFSQEYCME